MADPASLTVAFIQKSPLLAARALTTVEPGDAAVFLDSIPSRYAASALAHMNAWSASLVLAGMQPDNAAGVLRALDYQLAAMVLRLLGPEDRARLLQELPARLKRDFESSLSYPDDTVGAHMNTAVLTAMPNDTVKDAIRQIRRAGAPLAEAAYIVDDRKRLLGAVTSARLLRHPDKTILGDIMDSSVTPVSSRTRISMIDDLESWHDYVALPVVSRQRHVIGAISRSVVRRRHEFARIFSDHEGTMIAVSIAEAFLISIAGLFQLLAAPGGARHETASDRSKS